VLWVIIGYTLAFGPDAGGGLIGKLDFIGLKDVTGKNVFSGTHVPDNVFMVFQMMFAVITPALITGAIAERIKFSAWVVFCLLWSLIVYMPVAHWAFAADGWIFKMGARDFAGGLVVHINAGIAALVAAIIVGPRKGLGKVHFAPHSLMMSAIGTGMLWMGGFGFNAGSNLEATGTAGLAFFNTLFGTAVAGCAWAGTEWILKGKPSLLGICSGIVAGLVAITPAAGWVGPLGAFWIGLVAGVVCLLAVTQLKALLGYDDALDAFGVHGVGGIIGALGTGGFVNPALGGTGTYDYVANAVATYDFKTQMIAQLWGVGTALLWSGISAAAILLVLKYTIGVRASDEAQEEGLDLAEHGERAYNP
jgi:Amt family ammonium transporter